MSKKEERKEPQAEPEEKKPVRKKAKNAARPPAKPWKAASFSFGKKADDENFEAERLEAKRSEDVEKGLEAIYLAESTDDLGTIKHKKRRFWLKLLGGLLGFMFLLSVAVWTGFYFVDPYTRDTGGGLDLVIEAEESITLGKQERILIHWTNQSRQPIRNVEVRLSFPSEFTPIEFNPSPTDTENRIWDLGILSPDESGTIAVTGVFLGRLNDQAAIQVLGTYLPSDKKEEEELVKSFAIVYASTVLETEFALPPKLVAGDTFDFDYVIRNVSEDHLSDMEVRFEFPPSFLPSTSGTELLIHENDSRIWVMPVAELSPNTTSTFPLSGVFTAGTSGDQTFKASVGRETDLGDFLAIAETEKVVPVLSGDLGIQFVVNGSNENRSVAPGENLRMAIGYENLSPETLGDVELALKIETLVNGEVSSESFVSWDNLDDRTKGATSTENGTRGIRYTKDAISVFESMPAHQSGSIDVSVPTIPARNTARDVVIRLTVEGHIRSVGEDEVNRIVKAKPIELRYRTDADVAVEARYFLEEGAPIGTGPLPPVAGQTTRYRVFWVINKNIHELENVTVEATIPNIGAWANRVHADAGEIRYDEATRKVTWTLNRQPHDVNSLEGWFEVDVTPAELDIGRFANLLGESRFTATDADVGETISRSKPPLSTDLQNDEGARGKGVVRASGE